MELITGWELRQRSEARGVPVSGKQLQDCSEWGLLPERTPGRWHDEDVERLIRIRVLGRSVRQLHRRVILLRDLRWPTPPAQLRQAMIDTIPSISKPPTKLRAIYRAYRLRYGEITLPHALKAKLPPEWRLPETALWQDRLRWPSDDEFEMIAGTTYHDAFALTSDPIVKQSHFIDDIPFEEVVILLMTRQLSIPAQFENLNRDEDRK